MFQGVISTATSREEIFHALFELVKGAHFSHLIHGHSTWAGFSRKFVDPNQIPADAQPFFSQFEGLPEMYERGGNRLPPVRTLGARLFCWARVASGDTGELGTQYVTWMLEGIEEALKPEEAGYGSPGLQTLGGLVQWCRIEGTVLKFPGDTEHQALVCVPVRILWP